MAHCPYSRLGGHSDRETPGTPFRTRKLSLTAPMVLHPPGCGRVGHHRAQTTGSAPVLLLAEPGAEPVSAGARVSLRWSGTVRSPVRSSCLVHTVSTRGRRKGGARARRRLAPAARGRRREHGGPLTKGCPRRDRRPHERDCEWHRGRRTALARGTGSTWPD